jgi:hypothetical protein
MVGETLRMNEVVRVVERVLDEKWNVVTMRPEQWERRIETERDEGRKLWLQLGLVLMRDKVGEGILEPQLNKLFPDLEPLSVEGYMRK